MVVFFIFGTFFIVAGSFSNIYLTADDRFDTDILANFVEFDGAVHIAMIGNSKRIHADIFGILHHIFHFLQTVKE